MLDIDTLVLKPLQPLLDRVAAADFGVVGGEHHGFEPWNSFWAGILYFQPTEGALAYADLVARTVEHGLAPERIGWFLDQIALYSVYRCGFTDRPGPRTVLFPTDISRQSLRYDPERGDLEPDDDALFWSAHASTIPPHLTVETPGYRKYRL